MTLPKLDLTPLLQAIELPFHERIVVRVGIGCDEWPSPINLEINDKWLHITGGSLDASSQSRVMFYERFVLGWSEIISVCAWGQLTSRCRDWTLQLIARLQILLHKERKSGKNDIQTSEIKHTEITSEAESVIDYCRCKHETNIKYFKTLENLMNRMAIMKFPSSTFPNKKRNSNKVLPSSDL